MNRFFKKLIFILIVFCTISTVSLAGNVTNSNGKGTVTGSGTKEDPYKLVMGESIIDIYYKNTEDYRGIYFEFTSGNYNAGNYLVDHNADKKRIRFTLIGTDTSSLRVTTDEGVNYLQAGGITYVPEIKEEEKVEQQKPFYSITTTETFRVSYANDGSGSVIAAFMLTTDLGNGYISSTENLIAANKSTYATSYIFSKSDISYYDAYTITKEQTDNAGIYYRRYDILNGNLSKQSVLGVGEFSEDNDVIIFTPGTREDKVLNSDKAIEYRNSPFYDVSVVYCFEGAASETADSIGEKVNPIEELISKIFITIGDVFIKVTGLGGWGGDAYVTIDSLVFNEYPNTIVNFFGDTGFTNAKAQDVIEFWYNIFKAWAIVIYIILLIYIGIKTVLVSGTSKQKDVKDMLEGWLQGLLLLFFLPFLFKYLIVINDTIVDIIRVNSKYSVHAYYTFENMYNTLGGQEDGEDSTTTILERLKDAREILDTEKVKQEEKRDKLEETLEASKEILEKLLADESITNQNAQNQLYLIDLNKQLLDEYLKDNNILISINEKTQSINEIQDELGRFIKDFYAKEENRDRVLDTGNVGAAFYSDEIFKAEIKEYINNINKTLTDGNTEITDDKLEEVNSKIENLCYALVPKEAYDLIYKETENKVEEAKANVENIKKEIKNIEIAISKLENNDVDIMGEMRERAGKTNRFFYVAIWLVLVFEVILLLILYYKRLFMLMILIAVFPLVTVAYVYEKSKGAKPAILKNWIQEYIVNVFIQSIHAILYITLVEAGYAVYIANNDSWIVFIMAVLALISIEPVFKHMLGLKSSTVVDLGKYSASALKTLAVAGAVGSTFMNTRKDLKNIDNASKNKEEKIKKRQKRDDDRQETLRQHRDNKINKNEKLTAEEKERKLANKHEKDSKANERKEWLRKKAASARVHQRRLQRTKRIAKNASALVGTVAGGIAAGGQMDDFITAATVANALSGTGRDIKLSKEAEKAEQEKIKAESKIADISTDSTFVPREVNYSGSAYDDYGYSTSHGDSDGMQNDVKINTPTMKLFSRRLDETKIHVNRNINISEEDE